ncbi:MAG: hypothetical protein K9G49_13520 [Taibaiella sp.]|nr:hypothetical protein [Taibaiella sp.]
MNTLANSLWSISCPGSDSASDIIKFYPGGKAIIAFPCGATTKGFWAEATDGHFVIQSPFSPADPNKSQVYFGTLDQESAKGYWCETKNMLNSFTMKKES